MEKIAIFELGLRVVQIFRGTRCSKCTLYYRLHMYEVSQSQLEIDFGYSKIILRVKGKMIY